MTGCEYCGVGPEDDCTMDCPSRLSGWKEADRMRSEVARLTVRLGHATKLLRGVRQSPDVATTPWLCGLIDEFLAGGSP